MLRGWTASKVGSREEEITRWTSSKTNNLRSLLSARPPPRKRTKIRWNRICQVPPHPVSYGVGTKLYQRYCIKGPTYRPTRYRPHAVSVTTVSIQRNVINHQPGNGHLVPVFTCLPKQVTRREIVTIQNIKSRDVGHSWLTTFFSFVAIIIFIFTLLIFIALLTIGNV